MPYQSKTTVDDEEEFDLTRLSDKPCSMCDKPIEQVRIDALPGATTCIACARKYPRKADISSIELSQASPINRNGFAPSD